MGLDFSSIHEFKEAILEHSILNGRQIVFRPNDRVRARAKCNQKFGHVIFCSKVGRSEIYKIKTCRPKHHCGKVFKNKNASSEWVAMLSAEKLRSNNDIKLTQIMDDVIFRCGIAISLVVAWKLDDC